MNVTSVKESKKLQALRIPDRTADFVWIPENGRYILRSLECLGMDVEFWKKFENAIPAWSGDRLLDLLPEKLTIGPVEYQLIIKKCPNAYGRCTYLVSYRLETTNSGETTTRSLITSCTDTLYEGVLDVITSLLTKYTVSGEAIRKNIQELF